MLRNILRSHADLGLKAVQERFGVHGDIRDGCCVEDVEECGNCAVQGSGEAAGINQGHVFVSRSKHSAMLKPVSVVRTTEPTVI